LVERGELKPAVAKSIRTLYRSAIENQGRNVDG
jgi:hypothetical protein